MLSSDYTIKADTGITTSTAIQGKDASQMGMEDFMTLLVAQMTNQDMMDPQSNTEFISQMAQFSSLQGMQTLSEYQLSSYAVSYVGKNVSIAEVNETTGKIDQIEGVVTGVTFYDGAPQVVVNGKSYALHKVMEVNVQGHSSSLSEASQYIGKNVELYTETEDGKAKRVEGVVTSVTMMDDKAYVVIGKDKYPVSSITAVLDKATEDDGTSGTDETGGTEDTDGTDKTEETGTGTELDTDDPPEE